MDLSKAFDTLERDKLINKLQYHGITGTALALFKSYLKDRKQFVHIISTTNWIKFMLGLQ